MKTFLLISAALLVLVPSPALATTCSNTDPNATEYDTDAGTFYVTNDDCPNLQTGCTFSLWIYLESNQIPGLQRIDENAHLGATPCAGDTDLV